MNALMAEYDYTLTPNFDRGSVTNVTVSLYINSIDSINEQTMVSIEIHLKDNVASFHSTQSYIGGK